MSAARKDRDDEPIHPGARSRILAELEKLDYIGSDVGYDESKALDAIRATITGILKEDTNETKMKGS